MPEFDRSHIRSCYHCCGRHWCCHSKRWSRIQFSELLRKPFWPRSRNFRGQTQSPCLPRPSRPSAKHPSVHLQDSGSWAPQSPLCRNTFAQGENSSPVRHQSCLPGHQGGILCNESHLLNRPLVPLKSEFILHRSQVHFQRAVSSLPKQARV